MAQAAQTRMSGEGVYILMLDRPLGNERHSARYYVGWTRNLEGRLWYHEQGLGAAFTRAAVKNNIGWRVVLFIPGATREIERQIKNSKNTARWIESYQRKNQKVN